MLKSFLKKIKYEFGIKKIFFEIYPIYKFNKHKIDLLNKTYKENYPLDLVVIKTFIIEFFIKILLKIPFILLKLIL